MEDMDKELFPQIFGRGIANKLVMLSSYNGNFDNGSDYDSFINSLNNFGGTPLEPVKRPSIAFGDSINTVRKFENKHFNDLVQYLNACPWITSL